MADVSERDKQKAKEIVEAHVYLGSVDKQVVADSIAAALAEQREAHKRWCETYAAGVESQNDNIDAPVENWSDFHKGQVYAAKELAIRLGGKGGE